MKNVELPYQFALVPLDKCMIDQSYQRPSNPEWIEKKVQEFDVLLLGALMASQRPNGMHALIDGQQRWLMLKELGWSDAPSLVFNSLDIPKEASMFASLNFDKKLIRSWFHYRALRRGEDPKILAIDKIVQDRGFEIMQSIDRVDAIACPSTVVRIYDGEPEYVNKRYVGRVSGPEVLRRVLDVLNLSWRDQLAEEANWRQAKVAGMLRSISWWISSHPSVPIEDLAEKALRNTTPMSLVEQAGRITRGTGSGKGRKIEKIIDQLYQKTGKLPEEPEAEAGDAQVA